MLLQLLLSSRRSTAMSLRTHHFISTTPTSDFYRTRLSIFATHFGLGGIDERARLPCMLALIWDARFHLYNIFRQLRLSFHPNTFFHIGIGNVPTHIYRSYLFVGVNIGNDKGYF